MIIERFVREKTKQDDRGALERLMDVKIDGPKDFSRTIDPYIYGNSCGNS